MNVFVHSKAKTAAPYMLKGALPRNQRAESETSGAEWQKGK